MFCCWRILNFEKTEALVAEWVWRSVCGFFAGGGAIGGEEGLLKFFYLEAMDSIEVLVEDAWTQGKVDGARLTFQFSDAWGKKASWQVVTAGDGRGLLDLAGQRVREIVRREECSSYLTAETEWSAGHIRACAPKEHVFAKFTEQTDPNSRNDGQWINGQTSHCI